MNRRDRGLLAGGLLLVALHVVASYAAPGKLWGLSHLAAWPPAVGIGWSALVALALGVLPRRVSTHEAGARSRIPFPSRRGAALCALAAALPFWLARERTHFFGDGYLLIRDRGDSETVTRGPLLVRATVLAVHAAETHFGMHPETSMAWLSIVSGVIGVYFMLRLAAALTEDRGGRFLAAAWLLTAGSMQLFCGHVEYYAMLAAALLGWLLLATRAVRGGSLWPAWLTYGLLLPMHLSTLGLAPAQLALGVRAWKRGERRTVLAGAFAAAALALGITRLAGAPPGALAASTFTGMQRYLRPYLEVASSRHAFGFFSGAHGLAFCNDLLLVAPLAVVALPVLLRIASRQNSRGDAALHGVLGLASAGCALLALLFNREVGAYRDWDNLAAFGFVYLAWIAALAVAPHPGRQRAALAIVLLAGLHHLLPWIALNANPRAALQHAHLVLEEPSQWSPYARGYLHEEIAIYRRDRGDANGALQEYEAAVRANPSDARYHVSLGTHYFLRGEPRRAEQEFETALRQRPDFAPAHNNLAYVLLHSGGDLKRARAHLDAALRISPAHPDYLTTLGALELREGHLPQARAALEAALRQRPSSPEAARALEEVARRESGSPPAP